MSIVSGCGRVAAWLRRKLAALTGGKNYIHTVWGRGYVLRDVASE